MFLSSHLESQFLISQIENNIVSKSMNFSVY